MALDTKLSRPLLDLGEIGHRSREGGERSKQEMGKPEIEDENTQPISIFFDHCLVTAIGYLTQQHTHTVQPGTAQEETCPRFSPNNLALALSSHTTQLQLIRFT